jgi:hypothetical protein
VLLWVARTLPRPGSGGTRGLSSQPLITVKAAPAAELMLLTSCRCATRTYHVRATQHHLKPDWWHDLGVRSNLETAPCVARSGEACLAPYNRIPFGTTLIANPYQKCTMQGPRRRSVKPRKACTGNSIPWTLPVPPFRECLALDRAGFPKHNSPGRSCTACTTGIFQYPASTSARIAWAKGLELLLPSKS